MTESHLTLARETADVRYVQSSAPGNTHSPSPNYYRPLIQGKLYAVGPLAAELGVSITPVREALHDLANDGLVKIARNRGFTVQLLDDHDLDEIV